MNYTGGTGGPPPPPLPSQAPGPALPSAPASSPPPVASPASATPQAKMSNHYIRRLASSAKACFVCSRPSPVVLVSVTAGAEDFFYVCATHLGDRHMATRIQTSETASNNNQQQQQPSRLPDKVSKEEIERVKKEWEGKQKAKKEKEKDKDQDNKSKDGDAKKEESQGWLSYLASSLSAATVGSSGETVPAVAPQAAPATPAGPQGHEHYSLHRSFYQMRVDAQNKKIALKRAKELNFPSVPRQ